MIKTIKIAVLDDYSGAFRTGPQFPRLKDHEVVVFHDTERHGRPIKVCNTEALPSAC